MVEEKEFTTEATEISEKDGKDTEMLVFGILRELRDLRGEIGFV